MSPSCLTTLTANQRFGVVLPVLANKYNCQPETTRGAIKLKVHKTFVPQATLVTPRLTGRANGRATSLRAIVTRGLSGTRFISLLVLMYVPIPKGIKPLTTTMVISAVQAKKRLVFRGKIPILFCSIL